MLRQASLLVVLLALTGGAAASDVINIGGLFSSSHEHNNVMFKYAVDAVNRDSSLLADASLAAHEEFFEYDDSFSCSRKACSLLKHGVAAIFGPQTGQTAAHVQSICEALSVPHLEYRFYFRTTHAYSTTLYPSLSTLSQAYVDVVEALQWRKFCVIYGNSETLARVQAVLQSEALDVSLRQLPDSDDYGPLLKSLRSAGVTRLMLDVELHSIYPFLQQAQGLGMTGSGYHYFITSLDLHTVELPDFSQGATITGLTLMDPSSPLVQQVTQDLSDSLRPDHGKLIPLKTEAALLYDAVHLFAKGVDNFSRSSSLKEVSLDCAGNSPWEQGTALLNYMLAAEVTGLTGLVKLNSSDFRQNVTLHIIEVTSEGLSSVGQWDLANGANYAGELTEERQQDRTLVITSVFSDPYVMLREESEQLTGNDRYEGFCVDLIHTLSEMIGFNYTIKTADDKLYGSLDNTTGEWSGMIGELVTQKADVAIGDLTVTQKRESAVDFTVPWMNLGISLLYKKPTKKPLSLFIFLYPFSVDVWIVVLAAYLAISLLIFAIARCHVWAEVRRQDRRGSPCRLTDEGRTDTCRSGAEVRERSVSTHILNALWWFLTLVMVSLYASTVGGILSVEPVESPVTSVQDLAMQTKIKYGTMHGGATWHFFRSSKIPTYQRMFASMESQRPTVYTNSYKEGVRRVQESGGLYAFMMESPNIEYTTERVCDLMQVGGLLDSKSYSFALPTGSPYKKVIDQAILNLQEDGVLEQLKKRWWKARRGGGKCAPTDSSEGSVKGVYQLDLGLVGGVFVVLVVGVALAVVVAVCEFAWKSRAQAGNK